MTRASRSRLLGFVSVLGLLPALAMMGGGEVIAADTGGHGDAASCQALAGKTIASGVSVTSAEYNASGASFGRTKVSLPFCRIVGVAAPTSDSHIGFEIWLPPASSWNGKYQQEGSGGSSGSIGTASMLEPLEAGYATLATDNGHITDPDAPNGGSENKWALGHPQKMVDFAWRAVHESSVAAKAIVEKFYGKKAAEAYFVGCSTGGRQALMEATRFPADFDGIVAGAPAWHWTNQMVGAIWNTLPSLKDPSALTDESAALLNKAAIKACDKLDGLEDGVIADPRRCDFDPKSIACQAGASSECLTPVQVDAATRIYEGAHRSDGSRIFPGYARGSEAPWARVWAGKYPGGSSWDFWRYAVSQSPNASSSDFDFDKDTDKMLNSKLLGSSMADNYNARPDLTAFEKRGGKLIQYHGWADNMVSAFASVDFYNRIVAKIGKARADAFYRLFMAPGVNHCGGGPGVWNFGGASPAVSHDPQHDVVAALDAWVTRKQAPALLIGTHLDADKKADRTRPLCPYPLEGKYKGAGDINEAGNFSCADPGKLPSGAM
jgi:feruloyl esterase